jgi:hypothetical protein
MSDFKKYYQEILFEIERLKSQKEFEKAHQLLLSEINSPYIPYELIKYFDELKNELNPIVSYRKTEKFFSSLRKEELFLEVFKNKRFSPIVFDIFLKKYQDELTENDFQKIQFFLLKKEVQNSDKIFLLTELKYHGITKVFSFYNPVIQKSFEIDTTAINTFEDSPYYVETTDKIKKNLIKSPSLIALSIDILKLIFEYYYDDRPQYSPSELASNITNYINNYFGENNNIDIKFLK